MASGEVIIMKKICFYFIAAYFCLSNLTALAEIFVSTSTFSIDAPRNWLIQKTDDEVVFIYDEDKSDATYISVSSRLTKKPSNINEGWAKIRPLIVNDKDVIYDGDANYINGRWKKIVIIDKIGGINYKKVILFTVREKTRILVQFNASLKDYDRLYSLFEETIKTIKIKE